MKKQLKEVITNIPPKTLGLKKIKIDSFKKLGMGEGNLNYLFRIGNKKFICRINIDKEVPNKTRDEHKALKLVENLNIAPKVYYMHKADKSFPKDFLILEFIEGKPFRMKKRNYTARQIKQIAQLLARLHSKKITMPKKKYSYQHYIKEGDKFIKSINKYTKNKLDSKLEEISKKIKAFVPKKESHEFSLIHGDVCPQNIVETKKGLELIDWESLRYSDPAKDVANVLVDLGIKNDDLTLFMKEYLKTRKDKDILKRAKIYAVLLRHINFLWEIMRAFEIIHKKLPKEYLQKTSAKEHINEAKFQFRHLRKMIDVPLLDIGELF